MEPQPRPGHEPYCVQCGHCGNLHTCALASGRSNVGPPRQSQSVCMDFLGDDEIAAACKEIRKRRLVTELAANSPKGVLGRLRQYESYRRGNKVIYQQQ